MAGLGAFAAQAGAQNYDYLDRTDGISISAGDAPASNLAIQTPTPWPPQVNNVFIPGHGVRSFIAIDRFQKGIFINPDASSVETGAVAAPAAPAN
jgi:hypothetical protein